VDHLKVEEFPKLRSPAFLLAFAGWNDASSAATTAANFVVQELGGREFARIEADPFYNFQDMRPQVSLDESGMRRIAWPANIFYACETPDLDHDVMALVGVEPHLQWNRFAELILSVTRQCNVRIAVTVGALLADVYHRSVVRITGTSTDTELAARLRLQSSRYEGPTGIVGILNNCFRDQSVPAVSVWANVPHYVNVSPNPKAALALVRRLSDFLSTPFAVDEFEAGASEFEDRVDRALESNKAVREYVEQLRRKSEAEEEEEEAEDPGGLPSGDDLAREVQRFLREKGHGPPGGAPPGEPSG